MAINEVGSIGQTSVLVRGDFAYNCVLDYVELAVSKASGRSKLIELASPF